MALREVTREETSSWHQAGLTLSGEDQEFKGAGKVEEEGKGLVVDGAEGVKVDIESATMAKEEIKASGEGETTTQV